MGRRASLLCLILAVAGPLASQAKVAYGLALALSEIGRHVLESTQEVADEDYDGRELVTLAADTGAGLDGLRAPCGAVDSLAPVPIPITTSPSTQREVERWRVPWRWPPPTARQRCTLLQVFLI